MLRLTLWIGREHVNVTLELLAILIHHSCVTQDIKSMLVDGIDAKSCQSWCTNGTISRFWFKVKTMCFVVNGCTNLIKKKESASHTTPFFWKESVPSDVCYFCGLVVAFVCTVSQIYINLVSCFFLNFFGSLNDASMAAIMWKCSFNAEASRMKKAWESTSHQNLKKKRSASVSPHISWSLMKQSIGNHSKVLQHIATRHKTRTNVLEGAVEAVSQSVSCLHKPSISNRCAEFESVGC